ncbi:MAG: glycine dehydrogenase, partial [Frankiales bacterium]|nr:glycine dehydrogenase [Frankiales bacterium]
MRPHRIESASLSELEAAEPFSGRHIGPDDGEIAKMLAVVGHGSLAELAEAAVPEAIRATERLALPAAATEPEVLRALREVAAENRLVTPMIGTGYSGTHTPGVILRNILESPAWYTAYTPYQPEISQGRLEMLLNFQTVVSDLTGLDVSGASLL